MRLDEAREKGVPWKQWGPYLSERQWGTVREDYSENGDAWKYFTHDQARSRAYHWGEDGLAGFGDVTPVHPIARTLTNVEAIIGQFFPATLLARLISLELRGYRQRP